MLVLVLVVVVLVVVASHKFQPGVASQGASVAVLWLSHCELQRG
jgi:hypothetical protein